MPKFFCGIAIWVCPPGIAATSNCRELHLGKTAADTKLLRSKVLAATCRGLLIRKRCSSLLVDATHANPVRTGPVVHAAVERCCRDHDSHSPPDRICSGHSPEVLVGAAVVGLVSTFPLTLAVLHHADPVSPLTPFVRGRRPEPSWEARAQTPRKLAFAATAAAAAAAAL